MRNGCDGTYSMKVIAESVVQGNLWQVMMCCCTPWEVECGWVRTSSATQGGCPVRLTHQSPGATCAESPGMRAGERPYILLSCVQSRSAAGHETLPFLVRSTHPSSEGSCNPGRGVGASRVYPLDVGRNNIPARVTTTIPGMYIKAVP